MAKRTPISDTTIAHEVFSALTSIVLLGAVQSRANSAGIDFDSVSGVARSRADSLRELRDSAAAVAGLPDTVVPIFDEKAWWLGDPSKIEPWLVFHAGVLENSPVDLGQPREVRRLAEAGLDHLFVDFLDALVRGSLEHRPAGAIPSDALLDLLDRTGSTASGRIDPEIVYRMWRLSVLRPRLDPASPVEVERRNQLRIVARHPETAIRQRQNAP